MRCPACHEQATTFNAWLKMPPVFWSSLRCQACGCPLAGHGRRIILWLIVATIFLVSASLAWVCFWTDEVPPRPGPFVLAALAGIMGSGYLLWRTGSYSFRANVAGDAEAYRHAVARTSATPLSKATRRVMGVIGVLTIGMGVLGGITGRVASRTQAARVEPNSTASWLWGGSVIGMGVFLLAGAFLIERKRAAGPDDSIDSGQDSGC